MSHETHPSKLGRSTRYGSYRVEASAASARLASRRSIFAQFSASELVLWHMKYGEFPSGADGTELRRAETLMRDLVGDERGGHAK